MTKAIKKSFVEGVHRVCNNFFTFWALVSDQHLIKACYVHYLSTT